MMPVDLRPRPAAPGEKRPYRTPEERQAMVEPLRAMRERQNGKLWSFQINAVAKQHQVDPRTVRRALHELDQAPQRSRAPWKPPRELFVRIAMHGGNIAKALGEMEAEVAEGTASWDLRSYQTVHRAVHDDPGLQLALTHGMKNFDRYLLMGQYESEYVNELWYLDGMHIPVACVDRYGRLIPELYLISTFDSFSRLVVSHAVCIGQPTGELTADVILAGCLGAWVSVERLQAHGIETSAPLLLGGSPDALMLDNALANKAEDVRKAARLAGTRLTYARPHMPNDKAKQERWHSTLQRELAALPGFLDGPVPHPADGHPSRPYHVPADGRLPRVEALVETIDRLIDDYNWKHVISTTGQTPVARAAADDTVRRPIAPVTLWPLMTSRGTYRVHPLGVKLVEGFRTSTDARFLVETDVEIRGLEGSPGRTFFGTSGRFGGEVKPHAGLSEDEREARAQRNSVRGRTARGYLREAGERVEAEGLPDEDGVVPAQEPAPTTRPVARPASRRRNEPTELVVSRSAAVRADWIDPTTLEETVA